jgi:hypothetical protein
MGYSQISLINGKYTTSGAINRYLHSYDRLFQLSSIFLPSSLAESTDCGSEALML